MSIKHYIYCLLLSFILLPLPAHAVATDHQIRFENATNFTVNELSIGLVEFKDVPPGTVTGYQTIKTGHYYARGSVKEYGLKFFNTEVQIDGLGGYNWTLILMKDHTLKLIKKKGNLIDEINYAISYDKDAKLAIRMENKFNRTLRKLRIGPVEFLNVRPGRSTDYVPINPGEYGLSGYVIGVGEQLSGRSFIDDSSEKWTQVLTEEGDLILRNDKTFADTQQKIEARGTILRFRNVFATTVRYIKIGEDLTFYNVKPGQTTHYVQLKPGEYEVTGYIEGIAQPEIKTTMKIYGKYGQWLYVLTSKGLLVLIWER